jgi:hypothetical protein
VTSGLINKKFYYASLDLMAKETHLVFKDFSVYGKGGDVTVFPTEVRYQFCINNDCRHSVRTSDIFQINKNRRIEEAMTTYVLKYCCNISVLCYSTGRVTQCVRGNPKHDRGIPRFLTTKQIATLEKLLAAFKDTLVCLYLPSYSVVGKWISFPKLRHLLIDDIDEDNVVHLFKHSAELEAVEFSSNITISSWPILPKGLETLHYINSQRVRCSNGSGGSVAFPFTFSMNKLKRLKLEFYIPLTDGNFSLLKLQSCSVYVVNETNNVVKSQIVKSLCKSSNLRKLSFPYQCMTGVTEREWKYLFSHLANLEELEGEFSCEIIALISSTCSKLQTLSLQINDAKNDYLTSLSMLPVLKNINIRSDGGNFNYISLVCFLQGSAQETISSIQLFHRPAEKIKANDKRVICEEIKRLQNNHSLKDVLISVDESITSMFLDKENG